MTPFGQGLMRSTIFYVVLFAILAGRQLSASAAETSRGDEMLNAYFKAETQKVADACLANTKSFDDLQQHRDEYRGQLREMLGLDPMPEKTPLDAVVTGKIERDDFTVEKLYFQSRPHL